MTLRVHPDQILSARPGGLLSTHPSWRRIRLSDVADVLNGFAFPSSRFGPTGDIPLLRIRDVGQADTATSYSGDYEPQYVVQPGSLIIGMDGDFRVATWEGPPALLNQRVCKLSVRDSDLYDQRFLRWVLPGYLDAVHQETSSVTVKHLSSETVKVLPLPLPPRDEQRRIVEAIEEQFSRVDAGLAALERIRQHLKRMRTGVLQAAVTGRLVPQDPADGDAAPLIAQATAARREYLHAFGRKVSEPLQFSDEALPDIPSSWRWASLDLLAEVVGGITKDAKKQSSNRLIEVPYLRVANVQRGYLDLNKVATIRVSPEQRDALRLLPGDVLFNEGGDRDKLGRGWVWEGQIDPCIHQNHVFRARLHADVIHPRLLSWHGNSFGQQWFIKGGKQTTNLASVSKTTLRSFPVPIPPRGEQDRIVSAVERQLSLLDQLESTLTSAERRGERLRTSILAAAFSGQLVPQDPEDEPASVLLKRLASEQATSNGREFSPRTTRRRKATA